MSTASATFTEPDLWSEIVSASPTQLTEEGAKWILGLRFPQQHMDRMLELADKNNRGTLRPQEREEMERYLYFGNTLNMLHALARLALKQQGDAA
jgi:hypothetical protein